MIAKTLLSVAVAGVVGYLAVLAGIGYLASLQPRAAGAAPRR